MEVDENDQYYIRPMNCPHHHKVYAARPRSYRELPLRLSEYGNTFRYEKHGSLSGLLRVRAMCMNDAHIYCTPEQVKQEFESVINMYLKYYKHLRLGNPRVRLSLHDPNSDKFVSQKDDWIESEEIIRNLLKESNIEFEEEVGEAAFYGPKMDIQISNVMGREETVSTCQLDFMMAERFNLEYTSDDGSIKRPVIIHRAPLSTHERLISILIESYGGAFPTWIAPVQVCIIPVLEEVMPYAKQVSDTLRQSFFRAKIDDSNASFNKKIRNAITSKIPNIWIIGRQEQEKQTITWRRYCTKEQHQVGYQKAIESLTHLRQNRRMDNFPDVAVN
jgi:threonyl-tRNA synthetase